MDIEQKNIDEEKARIFNDYLSREDLKDPYNFTFDLDSFRMQHPDITQDIIHNPTKYYALIRSYLQKNLSGEERNKY